MTEELESAVLAALEIEDPNILRAACIMAGRMKLSQAERALLKGINNKAWQVQMEAVKALGCLGAKGALPYLRRALKASDADIRQKVLAGAVAKAVGAEGGGDELNPEVRRAIAIAINRLDAKIAQDALLAALSSGQPHLLGVGMSGLANLESHSGDAHMLELLNHEDPNVRKGAVASLGKLRVTAALDKLIELLRDADSDVRREAVIALNHLKAKKALEFIAEAMGDDSPDVRQVAAIALGNAQSKNKAIVMPLIVGLQDRDFKVRQSCLSALSNLKAASALEDAAKLLTDSHEAVARQAAATVATLAQYLEKPDYERE
jgi:HEAT repeat protein